MHLSDLLRAGLVTGILLLSGALAVGQSAHSDAKLRQIMERVQSASSAPGQGVYPTRNALSAEQTAARAALLRDGEAALSRLELDQSERLFDQAANLVHAADTEIGLVRTYMQGGAYRRALAFGAHTAGVHLDVIGGSALYAWLLHMGGQTAVARRLTDEALARQPDNRFMQAVARQLQDNKPLADGALLAPPTRLAPYGEQDGLPARARVVGSAVLLSDGTRALAPLALLPASGKVWVRNGMGQLRQARVRQRHAALGIAVLGLDRTLPVATELLAHSGPVFPGSAAYAVEYVAQPEATAKPAWPLLNIGFLGAPIGNTRQLALGIELKDGSGGGPVFDAAGRLLGLALVGKAGGARTPARLVSTEDLRPLPDIALAPAAPDAPAARAMLDLMYESSLRVALQLITAH